MGGAVSLSDHFIHQHGDTIKKGGYKDTLGGLIAVGIDIESKKNRIGNQRNAAHAGDQRGICSEKVKIFLHRHGMRNLPVIINDKHGNQGSDQANADPEFQVVFFKYL